MISILPFCSAYQAISLRAGYKKLLLTDANKMEKRIFYKFG
jgi:hypothetical protein